MSRPSNTTQDGVIEIGSDFEEPDPAGLTARTQQPLWESGQPAHHFTYLESGRQGLTLIEKSLAGEGKTLLAVPEYACDTMLVPFHRRGWEVVPLPMSRDLELIQSDALDGLLKSDPGRVAVLMASYFGRPYSDEISDIQDALHQRGISVIDDLTHRIFAPITTRARFHVASLRKVLPLFDGGFVQAQEDFDLLPFETVSGHTELSSMRHRAMAAKTIYLAGSHTQPGHRALFGAAEALLDQHVEPRPMSEPSRARVEHLDLAQIAERRILNALTVQDTLSRDPHIRVVNPVTDVSVPSHLVLIVDDATDLQRYLAENRIYAPIHWPESRILRHRPWPSVYVSLPIDQRYGADEMTRLAETVLTYFHDR